jgi:alkylhydroperoxidase family enzyme
MDDRFAPFRNATAAALLKSKGTTPQELRQAIADGNPPADLKTVVQKIRTRAYTVTDQDVDALRSRYTEDQLFEIIVSAAFGAASDRLAAAQRALDEA